MNAIERDKNIGTNKLLEWTIYLSLLLLPINCFYLGAYSEILFELAFYPYLIIFPYISILIFRRYYENNFVAKILLLFIYWVIISGVSNYYNISHSFFKGTAGLDRFSKQLLLIIIGYMIVLLISNVIQKHNITLEMISKYVIIAVRACVVVGIIEIMGKIVGSKIFLNLFMNISAVVNRNDFIPGRIHSLSGEPSWYGLFTSFALPFMIYNVVQKNSNKMLLALFLVTIYFTYSRTMYFIILLQLILFLPMIIKNKINVKNMGVALISCSLVLCVGFTNPSFLKGSIKSVTDTLLSVDDMSLESNASYSSMTRLGMQYTALTMGLHHPIIGVGEGQYLFHFKEYVPSWAMGSFEIQQALDPGHRAFPQVHGMLARIFAELGAVGVLIWMSVWITMFIKIYGLRKFVNVEKRQEINVLLCLIIGLFACGFNVDSFRMMVIWIGMGIISGWYMINKEKLNNKHKGRIL